MSTVILAEKPLQAKAYSSAYQVKNKAKHYIEIQPNDIFPSGAIITWGVGHLVALKMPGEYKKEWQKWNLNNLPIIPEQFEYKVSSHVKDQFNAVKKLFDDATTIINGCDVDREGSNIFYSILFMTGYKNTKKSIKRLWINSLEEDEIRKGFANLLDNKKDLLMYEEAQARQKSDWLVGMNTSQLYSLLLQKKGYSGSLSIGRVQSPTVYMIYQRQQEIETFISKPFYQIEGNFEATKGNYKGLAEVKEENKEKVQKILEQHNIQDKEQGTVQSVEKKEKRNKPPKLHSLSALQSTANKRWKYSPAEVLKIMQELYEKKLVTYPRTDCNYITESEFEYLKSNVSAYQQIIHQEFTPKTLEPSKRFVDGSKVEEHYAIVPTKTIPSDNTLSNLTDKQKNIYYEIVATTLGMFHDDYIYEETTVITNVKDLQFKTTGKTEKSKGWRELFPAKQNKESDTVLPSVAKDEEVTANIGIKEGKTEPPKPYTEGQLINMMKTCGKLIDDEEDTEILKEVEGLGTEATRSNIIERIKEQQYIEVKKNIVYVTEKGKVLCKSIEGTLLSSPSMTAKWETFLKKIGEGQASQEQFIKQTIAFINKQMKEVPEKLNSESISESIQSQQQSQYLGTCPSCKKGYVADKKRFYGCTEYKNGCSFTVSKKIAGKNVSEANVKKLLEKGKSNLIKGFKSKKGKAFDAYLKWDRSEGKITFEFKAPKKKTTREKQKS